MFVPWELVGAEVSEEDGALAGHPVLHILHPAGAQFTWDIGVSFKCFFPSSFSFHHPSDTYRVDNYV